VVGRSLVATRPVVGRGRVLGRQDHDPAGGHLVPDEGAPLEPLTDRVRGDAESVGGGIDRKQIVVGRSVVGLGQVIGWVGR
jgi:hypothetical protein